MVLELIRQFIQDILYHRYYDSMIAKLIVHGKTREEAIRKMISALEEFVIDGIDSNVDFHISILNNKRFREGSFDTSFISEEFGL